MKRINTVQDIIDLWGLELLADDMDVEINTVRQWKSRGFIPRHHHAVMLDKAQDRNLDIKHKDLKLMSDRYR